MVFFLIWLGFGCAAFGLSTSVRDYLTYQLIHNDTDELFVLKISLKTAFLLLVFGIFGPLSFSLLIFEYVQKRKEKPHVY